MLALLPRGCRSYIHIWYWPALRALISEIKGKKGRALQKCIHNYIVAISESWFGVVTLQLFRILQHDTEVLLYEHERVKILAYHQDSSINPYSLYII